MTRPISWVIERHRSVGSTMDLAAERARAGAPQGTVVVADHQTAGRGRSGRSWLAPPGAALMLTAILRPFLPPDRLAALSLVAGVALAEAVEAATGLACWLKWPNDLWLGDRLAGRKAAGILVTARLGPSGIEHVLVGIGVNSATPPAALPPGATSLEVELAAIGKSMTTVTGVADPRDCLLDRVLDRLEVGYACFVAGGGRPPLDDWIQRAALLGESVELVTEGKVKRGRFVGVRPDGALLLRGEDGVVEVVVAGDLVRGPRYRSESAGVRFAR